jgi:N6-L-threonylcarbamoyladenine synthase
MLVLGIETTCDETAIGVVENGKHILANVIESQIPIHSQYGGVFPELASRHHVDKLIPTLKEALNQAKVTLDAIDLISVAYGPGLMGSLITGVEFAKHLSFSNAIPLVKVNHVEAHLYSAMMATDDPIEFPVLGVIISGGHTHLVEMKSYLDFQIIGCTQDDAIGEAFDKVGALLELPYPGGPAIEKLAVLGDPSKFPFKAGNIKSQAYDFSYSGLKTQVLYAVKGTSQKQAMKILADEDKKHVAASFQKTAFYDLIEKILKAAKNLGFKQIFLGGGVSNNCYLRQELTKLAPPTLSIYFPHPKLTIDNGAMIAGLGYHVFKTSGQTPIEELVAISRPPFSRA